MPISRPADRQPGGAQDAAGRAGAADRRAREGGFAVIGRQHIMINRLDIDDADFDARADAAAGMGAGTRPGDRAVGEGDHCRRPRRGDAAVLDYTRRFDRLDCADAAQLRLQPAELRAALESLPHDAASRAGDRGRADPPLPRPPEAATPGRTSRPTARVSGQRVLPIDRVGLYVPGGKAAYPSSVLMNAIPARVAGVRELAMVVPTPGGARNPMVLAAACIAGIDEVYTIGGAHAVAALAFGTGVDPCRRQDRRSGQRLCRAGQARGVRHRRHRHDRRAVGDPRGERRFRAGRTGWRWTCSRRPSTTKWRRRS